MYEKLYIYRFEIFFFSLLTILFGGVFFSTKVFESVLIPILYLVNISAGVLLISKNKRIVRILLSLFGAVVIMFVFSVVNKSAVNNNIGYGRIVIYSIFYIIVTYELIKQVWKSAIISKNVIIGVMCGYICVGLICFFLFSALEMSTPGSFKGLNYLDLNEEKDSLLYFTYITLLSIGYGDITPLTIAARKITMLTGFIGQFYMVILTATIVGKYINQSSQKHI